MYVRRLQTCLLALAALGLWMVLSPHARAQETEPEPAAACEDQPGQAALECAPEPEPEPDSPDSSEPDGNDDGGSVTLPQDEFDARVEMAASSGGLDCNDFSTSEDAQIFYELNGEPAFLDGDGDGLACENLPASLAVAAAQANSPSPVASPSGAPFVDHDCGDFLTQAEAQTFFEREGGSTTNDPHALDEDHDGKACEILPGSRAASTGSQVLGRTGASTAQMAFGGSLLLTSGLGLLYAAGRALRRRLPMVDLRLPSRW